MPEMSSNVDVEHSTYLNDDDQQMMYSHLLLHHDTSICTEKYSMSKDRRDTMVKFC